MLSEAINSIFRWYKNSVICYAYLADITYWPTPVEAMERLSGAANADEGSEMPKFGIWKLLLFIFDIMCIG